MKALKISAAILGALLLLAVALVFLPAVQTWAVRRAVAGQPGLTIELGRVAAGLSSAELLDVRIVKDGAIISATRVAVSYSAWDYVSKKRINVDQLAATGLLIDLRQARVAAAPATPAAKAGAVAAAPFAGLLNLAQLPVDVRLAQLAVEGRALLTNSQSVAFTLQGAGIETGQRGKLEWKVTFADTQKAAAVSAVRTDGTLAFRLTADRRIDLADLDTTIATEGPGLPADRIALSAKAEQVAAGGNETYTIRLGLDRPANSAPLLSSRVEYRAASHDLAGSWDVALGSDSLATLLTQLGLPEIALTGAGKFTLQPDTTAVTASGELRAQLAHLEKLFPALATIGGVNVRASFDGGLANNRAELNTLAVETTATDGRKLAQVNVLQKVGFNLADKRATIADPKSELARVTVQKLPLAWAQSLAKPLVIESGELSLVLAVEAESDGSHVRIRAVEPLTLSAVTVRDGAKKLVDQLTLSVRPQVDYSAARLTAELTDLTASLPTGDKITGRLGADITNLATTPAIAFSTEIQAKLVTALRPFLPFDPGVLSVTTATTGRLEGPRLEVAKSTTTVSRDNGSLLLSVALLQPLKADLKKTTFAFAQPEAAAVRVALGELPLGWAETFVPKSQFTGTLAGGAFEIALRSLDDLSLKTAEPLTLRAVSVNFDGKPQVKALDVTADLSATKHGDVVAYDVRRLELKQGVAPLLTLAVAGETKLGAALRATAKGTLDVDAAALLNQPALAPFATISRGRLTTAFDVTIADTIQAKAVVAVRNLTARATGQPLGDLELKLTAALKSDGTGSVSFPLLLTAGGRRSDLTVDGTFARTATLVTFNGKIASTQLVADDFQALAALAPAPPPAKVSFTGNRPVFAAPVVAGPSTAARPTRDAKPFWTGFAGQIETDLKSIRYGADYTISGVHGSLAVTEARLAVDKLEGRFKENPFKLTAGITFAASKPQPYALTAAANVANLDIGEILRAANPSERPALETKVSVDAKLSGNGATLPTLLEGTYGQFDVGGTKGTLRALGNKGKAVGALSSVVGLLGALQGSDTTVASAELAGELNEMPFDKFTAHVDRGADLDLKLTALEFISPSMRLTGTGGITYQKGVPIDQQPLRVELQLAGKEHLAYVLNKAALLAAVQDDTGTHGKQDEKGYYLLKTTFILDGTLAKPDSSQLWSLIGQAAARALLR